MRNLGRAVFLGACGAALLATLHLGSAARETSHARTDRRGPEAPPASDRDHASCLPAPGTPAGSNARTEEGAGPGTAARAQRDSDRKAESAARADRRARSEWEHEMRRLEREAQQEQRRRERDARRAERKRAGKPKPAPLFEPPPLGPPVEGVEGLPEREER